MLATPKTTTKLRLRIVLIDRVIVAVHTVHAAASCPCAKPRQCTTTQKVALPIGSAAEVGVQ